MPTSTNTFGISPYEIANELSLHKDKPLLVNQRKKSAVSLTELPPSPADSEPVDPTMSTISDMTENERRIIRPMDRGAPGDRAIFSDLKTPVQKQLARQKSQYYGEVFAYREPNASARERVSRESMIMVDLRTNVIVTFTFTDERAIVLMPFRFKTNTLLLPIYPTSSPLVTSGLNPPSSSQSHILHACCSVAPLILHT
jgi:hypothetical protein